MVRAWRVGARRILPRRNGETRVRLHRRATFLETLRNDAVKHAVRNFNATKCATHARATRAP
eukprot:8837945-Lingulodinium_polyedra.AAC.1